MTELLGTKTIEKEYKPLDLTLVLSMAASVVGISVKKIKTGRIVGESELNNKIELAIELYIKYVLEHNEHDNYDRETIVAAYNGYVAKITVIKNRISNGLSAKKAFLYKELCTKIIENEK